MNPASPNTPQPSRPIQDVTTAPAAGPDSSGLTTSIVQNIPMRTQAGPVHEDAELDKIMEDVGKDLHAAEAQPKKRGFFSRKQKVRPQPKPPVGPAPLPPAQPQAPTRPVPQPTTQALSAAKRSTPVMVIFMTIVITGVLIAAAIYSYK